MSRWFDILTRTSYTVDEAAVATIQHHLASKLGGYLHARGQDGQGRTGDAAPLKALADGVASFWAEQYPRLIYPVRVTADPARPYSAFRPVEESPAGQTRALTAPWRDGFLKPGAPPLLPAAALGVPAPPTLLAGEWALASSAYALCASHPPDSVDSEAGETLAALRLGILLFPLWNALGAAGEPLQALADHPTVRAAAALLAGSPAPEAPDAWRPILAAIATADPAPADQGQAWLLVGSFYRIKQYVFESPALHQIRGASILLEQVIQEAARQVSDAFGPECVVRQAGGSLVALLPVASAEAARAWEDRITALAYRAAGTARFAAGSAPVSLISLLPGRESTFGESQRQAHRALETRRAQALEPMWETLPFEARCERCGQRAAEITETGAGGELISMCRICHRREEVGRTERRRLIEGAWQEVDVDPSTWVHPETDALGRPNDPVPPSLEELVPKNRRRRWIAMVYGDGNNFGAIVQRLGGLTEHLHWTRRLYWTVRGLTHLSLVGATVFFAEPASGGPAPEAPGPAGVRARCTHYPFEILTLGGDDVAFFAWAPVGLKAVERLQAGLQHEFAPGPGEEEHAEQQVFPPITFSFGVAIGDDHTPVRRFREIAEDVLLKTVKDRRHPEERQGRIAFFAASNPSEMTPHRVRQLWRMERRAENGGTTLLSVQPLTSGEFAFLLEKALGLSEDVGRLMRLTAPFTRTDPTVAALNYRYNAARARSRGDEENERRSGRGFYTFLESETRDGQGWSLFTDDKPVLPLLIPRPGVAGEWAPSSLDRVVPLLDLLQLARAMQ